MAAACMRATMLVSSMGLLFNESAIRRGTDTAGWSDRHIREPRQSHRCHSIAGISEMTLERLQLRRALRWRLQVKASAALRANGGKQPA